MAGLQGFCILAINPQVYSRVATLLKERKMEISRPTSEGVRVQWRVIPCGGAITSQPLLLM